MQGLSRLSAFGLLIAALCGQSAVAQQAPSRPAASKSIPDDPFGPASAIIADVQRIVAPNGIDETLTLPLGGARQVVNIRGADRRNPILIYIHGGPGSVEMPMAWTFQHPWEDFFTVVQWDQRGAGRSYPLNDPATIAATLTFDRYRDDAIELIEQLRTRLGQPKVFLLGHSFGSTVGLAVAQKRPDLLYAYIGMGQLIDARENERVGMARTLATARQRGDAEAVRAIEALRPYPDAGPFTIDKADAWRAYANRYGSLAGYRSDAHFYFDSTKLSPLYTPADRKAWNEGSAFTVTTLWPRIADLSFSALDHLDVPVMLLLGERDTTTPSDIAERWLAHLAAPGRTACRFAYSGHLPMIEEPGKTLLALLSVRPRARPAEPATVPTYCEQLGLAARAHHGLR
jgi:pimeloyl-ACP methyl ester carboxylesterase